MPLLHVQVSRMLIEMQTVWTLEMKRRNNDQRIVSLHGEMKDMMEVLIQCEPMACRFQSLLILTHRLKNVKDAKAQAPDGTSIEGRMQDVAKSAAKDIIDCANACDTYLKKSAVGMIKPHSVLEQR